MNPIIVKQRPLSNIALICGLVSCTQGFVPILLESYSNKKILGRLSPDFVPISVLRSSEDDNDEGAINSQVAGNDNADPKTRQKQLVGHLGGRRRRSVTKNKSSALLLDRLSKWTWAAVPILAVLFFLKSLFGGSNDNPNFVYYESSMFESRIYNGNGRVDVRRQESIRSNVPSLLEGKRLQQQQRKEQQTQNQLPSDSSSSSDEDFEQELQSLMRDFQRTIYIDFY